MMLINFLIITPSCQVQISIDRTKTSNSKLSNFLQRVVLFDSYTDYAIAHKIRAYEIITFRWVRIRSGQLKVSTISICERIRSELRIIWTSGPAKQHVLYCSIFWYWKCLCLLRIAFLYNAWRRLLEGNQLLHTLRHSMKETTNVGSCNLQGLGEAVDW